MRRLFGILPMLLAGLALGEDVGPIDAGVARRRIAELAAASDPSPQGVGTLEDIAERTADRELSAIAWYNAGTMALALGDARAEDLLRKAEQSATEPGLRADARFNLAHAALGDAGTGSPDESREAVEDRIGRLRRAAELFRSVLDLRADHAAAAANTERVRRMIRDLERRLEELAEQERMRERLAEQLGELADEQRRQAEESRSRGEQNDAESTQEQEASANRAAAETQEQLSTTTEQTRERSEEAGAPSGALDAIDEALRAQERATEALRNNDAEGAARAQEDAARALREAAERSRPPRDGSPGEGEGGGDAEGSAEESAAPEPQPEAEQGGITPLARALLEKERSEREQRMRYLQKTGRQRVERDW